MGRQGNKKYGFIDNKILFWPTVAERHGYTCIPVHRPFRGDKQLRNGLLKKEKGSRGGTTSRSNESVTNSFVRSGAPLLRREGNPLRRATAVPVARVCIGAVESISVDSGRRATPTGRTVNPQDAYPFRDIERAPGIVTTYSSTTIAISRKEHFRVTGSPCDSGHVN
ncbi:hypothetical protein ALC57_08117 [Trachymyrmex cornetzi]|uniref:Uncharacterized protein n=1 Tax=Trachymyrmex cornetzi TaxID=471704 RepID=A0A195E3J4_9HYME|nr:hypothetical protein ALC57_08117 [Trachymyrmex cornetzi]